MTSSFSGSSQVGIRRVPFNTYSTCSFSGNDSAVRALRFASHLHIGQSAANDIGDPSKRITIDTSGGKARLLPSLALVGQEPLPPGTTDIAARLTDEESVGLEKVVLQVMLDQLGGK
ncbi:MAG: hypothetical protein ABL921_06815 [Pirellula sp.]